MTTLIKYLKSLIRFNSMKIDVAKGIRQCILMLIPLLVGYLTGHFSKGLLISTGTLAHIMYLVVLRDLSYALSYFHR